MGNNDEREFVLKEFGNVEDFVDSAETTDALSMDEVIQEKIIGTDNRQSVPDQRAKPYPGILEIETQLPRGYRSEFGTGWMISHQVVITAAHVILPKRDSRRVRPASIIARQYSSAGFETLQVRAKAFRVLEDFLDGSDGPGFDFGAIVLSTPITSGHRFGWGNFSTAELEGKHIEIAGYPVDKTQGKMFWHSSRIAGTGHSVINYRADTYGGQSGAPAFTRFPRNGKTAYIAVGIHKGAAGAFNRATRINAAVNERLKAWKTLS